MPPRLCPLTHRVFALFSLTMLLPLFTFTADAQKETRPLRVGLVLPLSGPVAPTGDAARKGFALALEEAKFAGLRVFYEDNCSSSAQTVAAYRNLRSLEDIDIVLSFGSTFSSALAPLTRADGVPLLVWAADPQIAAGHPQVVRLATTGVEQGEAAATEALRRNYAKISLVLSEDEYSTTFGKGFASALPAGLLVEEHTVPPGLDDFRTLLTRGRARGIEQYCACLLPGQVANFARQLREVAPGAGLFGCETLYSAAAVKAPGSALDGSWFITPNVTGQFRGRFKKRYGNIDYVHAAAPYYETAVQLLRFAASAFPPSELIPWLQREPPMEEALAGARFLVAGDDRYLKSRLAAVEITHGEARWPDKNGERS